MKKSVAAVNEVEGNMAEEEKEFIDLRAQDGEEKNFMDVELEAENIFQDEMEWRWNLEKLEKKRKTLTTQQEFKKAARQLGALDDVPLSLKTCYKEKCLNANPATNQRDVWEKAMMPRVSGPSTFK